MELELRKEARADLEFRVEAGKTDIKTIIVSNFLHREAKISEKQYILILLITVMRRIRYE